MVVTAVALGTAVTVALTPLDDTTLEMLETLETMLETALEMELDTEAGRAVTGAVLTGWPLKYGSTTELTWLTRVTGIVSPETDEVVEDAGGGGATVDEGVPVKGGSTSTVVWPLTVRVIDVAWAMARAGSNATERTEHNMTDVDA